ncbi:MAG: SusD/RagB family nutrient-binding outer membrane lipoprotein, partial [Salibacteraceae bacterium]|nr:SusD/RagB family nutrient-binding outer membrane lipoprotein [Salibacteraceae bacterium]
VMSATMDEIMDRYADPRVSVFFRRADNDGYRGLLNGQDASQSSITVSNYSFAGASFRENTGDLDANFLTAWETQFWLAEAALKGYISGDAQSFYESGVALAFDYWMTDLPESYLTLDSAAYGALGQDPLEQIITQKWIANTINGYEGWIEYNRTGFPKFKTLAASLNNDLIPSRLPYPTDEQALNAANFDAAAANTNGNSVNAEMWWKP